MQARWWRWRPPVFVNPVRSVLRRRAIVTSAAANGKQRAKAGKLCPRTLRDKHAQPFEPLSMVRTWLKRAGLLTPGHVKVANAAAELVKVVEHLCDEQQHNLLFFSRPVVARPKQIFIVVTAPSHPSTTHIPHREIGRVDLRDDLRQHA